MGKTVLNKRSSVVNNGVPKAPDASALTYGEIAVNFADGHEKLFIKNNNNQIVSFSTDEVYNQRIGAVETVVGQHTSDISEIYDALDSIPFAEGSGTDSAEQRNCTASGDYSVSEGYQTSAAGNSSHAEGVGTVTYNIAEHAEGQYNKSYNDNSTQFGSGTNTIHTIGIGTSDENRKNAVEIKQNGDIYVFGIGGFGGTHPAFGEEKTIQEVINTDINAKFDDVPVEHGGGTNSVRQKGVSSHSASGEGSFSANQGLASGKFSFAANNNGNAQGENSAAFGYKSVAVGKNSFAEGNECIAYSLHSHAEGYDTLARSLASHAEGVSTVAGDGDQKTANSTTTAGYFSHAEGNGTLAKGNSSHAEGKATQATQYTAHAEGLNTIANGVTSHAEGANTRAGTGNKQSAHSNTNEGVFTHAEGNGTLAKGNASHAEGVASESLGRASHAEGYSTVASAAQAHSEGGRTTASSQAAHAEGYSTTASGSFSHAEGNYTEAKNQSEHAEGQFNVSHSGSTSFGSSANTIHSVGMGTSSSDCKNAVEVMQNGDTYMYGFGGYDGTNPSASTPINKFLTGANQIVIVTQTEYNTLVSNNTLSPTTLYIVK